MFLTKDQRFDSRLFEVSILSSAKNVICTCTGTFVQLQVVNKVLGNVTTNYKNYFSYYLLVCHNSIDEGETTVLQS